MENIAQVKRVFRILFSWVTGLTLTSAVITVLAGIMFHTERRLRRIEKEQGQQE